MFSSLTVAIVNSWIVSSVNGFLNNIAFCFACFAVVKVGKSQRLFRNCCAVNDKLLRQEESAIDYGQMSLDPSMAICTFITIGFAAITRACACACATASVHKAGKTHTKFGSLYF